jgi:hypothetical protein
MPTTSIIVGVLLILIGAIGYVHGMMTGHASPTALIPSAFGFVIAVLGGVAAAKDGLRKHLMHVAVVIALIGFIFPVGRLVSKYSELTMSAAVVSQAATAFVCLMFVILAIRSFANARRG